SPSVYPLSLHDALPICCVLTPCPPGANDRLAPAREESARDIRARQRWPDATEASMKAFRYAALLSFLAVGARADDESRFRAELRSEEHTSELQSLAYLV